MSFPDLNKPSHLLATFFGVGLLKPAPGTWGSLAAVLLWYFLDFLHSYTHIILPAFILCSWLVCIKADQDSESKDNSLILVTALAPHIGYDNSAKIANLALKNKTTLKHEAIKSKLISEKDYNKIVNPKKMIYPA